MNSRTLSIVLLIALVLSGATTVYFAVQAREATQRADVAEKKLHAQDFLRNYAADMQPGTFVRATDTTFTYTTPLQQVINGETFISEEEHTVKFDSTFTVFGGLFGDGPSAVAHLEPGRSIRVMVLGTGDRERITQLYVSP